MTYQGYISWAQEYREQADVINERLKKMTRKRRYASAEEKNAEENKVQMLYMMKCECLKTMSELETIAKQIKEREGKT